VIGKIAVAEGVAGKCIRFATSYKLVDPVNMKMLAYFCLGIFFLTGLSCFEHCSNNHNCYQDYIITVPISISPAKDTFQIGDTIWVESEIPSILFDSVSQQEVDLGDFIHKIYAGISKRNPPSENCSESKFRYLQMEGEVRLSGPCPHFLQIKYERSSTNNWRVRFGMLPEASGLYNIGFLTFREDYSTEEGIILKPCTEEILTRYNMNGRIDDNNYHLLMGYPNINTPQSYILEGEYAFWVKE
jgi:hypothetical protein